MNNLADLTSRPVLLRVPVRDERGEPTGAVLEYRVSPLTYEDHGTLQRWVDAQFPNPFDQAWEAIQRARAKGQPFNVTQEQFLLKNAQELAARSRHPIGTPEADRLLWSDEGVKQILLVAIRKGDPSFDESKAAELVKHMTPADVQKAYIATQLDLVMHDPKDGPPDGSPRSRPDGPSTSRRTRRAAKAGARTGGKSSIR
jgi:hypothetical protein